MFQHDIKWFFPSCKNLIYSYCRGNGLYSQRRSSNLVKNWCLIVVQHVFGQIKMVLLLVLKSGSEQLFDQVCPFLKTFCEFGFVVESILYLIVHFMLQMSEEQFQWTFLWFFFFFFSCNENIVHVIKHVESARKDIIHKNIFLIIICNFGCMFDIFGCTF
jgi:hypothetical protein